MGHLVNPISLRLGRTQLWRSQWYKSTNREYISTLKEDFILYKYIESFFINSHLLKKRIRSIVKLKGKPHKNRKNQLFDKFKHLRPSKRKRIRLKRYASSKMIQKLSMLFSHVNLIRVPSTLIVNMHIYDGAFETSKLKSNKRNKFSVGKNKNLVSSSVLNSNESIYSQNSSEKLSPRLVLKNFFDLKSTRRNKRNKSKNVKNLFSDANTLTSDSKNLHYLNSLQLKQRNYLKASGKCTFTRFSNTLTKLRKVTLANNLTSSLGFPFFNLELRYLNTRLHYLCKMLHNPFYFKLKKVKIKTNSVSTHNNNISYFFKLLRLLALLHLKGITKSKLQQVFFLRLLLHVVVKLRQKINIKLKRMIGIKKSFDSIKHRLKYNKKNQHNSVNFRSKVKKMVSSFRSSFNYRNKKKFQNRLNSFKLNYIKLNKFLLYIVSVCSQYTIENRNLRLYQNRFTIWYYVSRILYENIKTILFVPTFYKHSYSFVKLNYFGLTNNTPTAAMLIQYITNKLYQKYTLFEVLKPLTRDLSSNFAIDGFKISCAGRLTKKERASVFVQQDKKVPANTLDSFIDYSTSIVRLRHGICGLKIWVTRKKTYKSFAYHFSYQYAFNRLDSLPYNFNRAKKKKFFLSAVLKNMSRSKSMSKKKRKIKINV